MSDALRLARPALLALGPPDVAGAPVPGTIRLDANENPFVPLGGGVSAVNRYPEPQPAALRRRLAELYGVASERLWVTRGSDDGIDLLVRSFCEAGIDRVGIVEPTFSAYARFAALQGAEVVRASLGPDFAFDADRVIAAMQPASPKLLFLCTPNNPTGSPVAAADVRRIVAALPDTLVIADEAYAEFEPGPGLAAEAGGRLLVLRTLSKAYGLAGARIGVVIGDETAIDLVSRASPPYPLPLPSIETALAALAPERMPIHAQRIAALVADRAALAHRLEGAEGVRRVWQGGNFLFLDVADPQACAVRLAAAGVRVRFRPQATAGGVRITIGTEAENAALLAVFGLGAPAPTRRADLVRDTKETQIALSLDLDRPGPRRIDTGIGFYDHMLDQVASHGGFSLTLTCTGDREIDAHHSIEDVALALGAGLREALGDKKGIARFGFALPMDEASAQVLLDLSGRAYSRFEGKFAGEAVGDLPTQMVPHVFRSLADSLGAALHVTVAGDNDHHKVEAAFKALGRALRQAIRIEGSDLPSTKGLL